MAGTSVKSEHGKLEINKVKMMKLGEHIIMNKVLFDIDYYPLKIQQHDRPENSLMIDRALAKDGYYHFRLDYEKGNQLLQLPKQSEYYSSIGVPVKVLEKKYVDDFIIAQGINSYSLKHRLNFLVPDRYIIDRFNGRPPETLFGDLKMIYDAEKGLILPVDGKSDPIPLSRFTMIDTGYITENDEDDLYYMEGFYDVKNRKIIDLDTEALETWPKGIVLLTIGSASLADPIGVAKRLGQPLVSHLSHRYWIDHGPAAVEDLSSHFQKIPLSNKKKIAPTAILKKERKKERKLPF